MQRRTFLLSASALAATTARGTTRAKPMPTDVPAIESLQANWRSFVPDLTDLPTPITSLDEGKPEWHARLPDDACREHFNASTEGTRSSSPDSPLDEKSGEGLFVFHDGPAPTNEHCCHNGIALRFIARKGATVG